MEKDPPLTIINRLVTKCTGNHPNDPDLLRAVALIGELSDHYEVLPKDDLTALRQELQKLKEVPLQYAIYLGPSVHDERDVLVGVGSSRYEVRLADGLKEKYGQLRPGQQVLLNRDNNVVAIRDEYIHGETAEVVNLIKPDNSAEVIAITKQDDVITQVTAKWREGEEQTFVCAEALKNVQLRRGDIIEVNPDSMLAVAKIRSRLHVRAGGSEGTVVEISDRLFEEGVRLGELVRIDAGLKFAFEKLPSFETGGLTLEDVPDVTYDDIGGLNEQIDDFRDAIEMPYLQRILFTRYQLTRPKGILLYGPPGCGKTMVAKAVANSLTESIKNHLTGIEKRIRLYLELRDRPTDKEILEQCGELFERDGFPDTPEARGELFRQKLAESLLDLEIDLERVEEKQREVRAALGRSDGVRSFFLNVKGPELLDKYVGETEHRIRSIFEEARNHATYYTPVIIFFDEMESMFRARGTGRSSDVETTIVPQFLSELDGVEKSDHVLLIGATNREDMIDPAILRPGRLDVKIRVGRPNREAAAEIFSLYLLPTLPLNEKGLEASGRRQVPGNLVFRTAYSKPGLDLGDLHDLLPQACDVRLAQSFIAEELEHLASLPPDMTVRQACTNAQTANDSNPLWSKLSGFRTRMKLGDITRKLRQFTQRTQTDSKLAALVARLAEQEQIAESLIDAAVELLYNSSSYVRVTTRSPYNSGPARYTFAAHDFITGAVITNIVSRAKRSALKRQVTDGQEVRPGISLQDIVEGINKELFENREHFAAQKVHDELGKAGEEIQNVELHLDTERVDLWNEEKPRPYRFITRD